MDFRKPVFYDERQRRWRWTRRVLEIGGAFFTLLLLIFFFNILKTPPYLSCCCRKLTRHSAPCAKGVG